MPYRAAMLAMGTRFELVLAGESDATNVDRSARRDLVGGRDQDRRGAAEPVLQRAAEAALEVVRECDERLSCFRRDSLLSHVNRHAHERPVRVDLDTFELLLDCQRVWTASQGAFDPTLGPLMRSLGFHDRPESARDHERSSSKSAAGELAAQAAGSCDWAQILGTLDARLPATPDVGFEHVRLDERAGTISFTRPGLELDLGGIAKGHALDLAARVLREHGVDRALLHAGTSSVLALGTPPREHARPGLDRAHIPGARASRPRASTDSTAVLRGWRVRIGHAQGAPVACLCDMALSVSGQHGRRLADGRGHVLDPRTRAPAAREGLAAVIHASARLADAWSTALLVMGEFPALDPGLGLLLGPASDRAIVEHAAERTRAPAWRIHGAFAHLYERPSEFRKECA